MLNYTVPERCVKRLSIYPNPPPATVVESCCNAGSGFSRRLQSSGLRFLHLTLQKPGFLGSMGLLLLFHTHFPLGLWNDVAATVAKNPLVSADPPPIHIYAASFE